MKISIVYYNDLFEAHVGGIMSYIRGLLRYCDSSFRFVYWQRSAGHPRTDDFPNTVVRDFTKVPRRKIGSELVRVICVLYRWRARIERGSDCLLFHTADTVLPWVFRRTTMPLVLVCHVARQHELRFLGPAERVFYQLADRLAMRRADRTIFVSEEMLQYFSRRFPRYAHKFVYVQTFAEDHTVPRETREEARKALELPDSPVVAYVGRFNKQKRVPEVVESFSHLLQSHPNALLCLAGSGEEEQRVRDKIAELGIDRSVRLMGVLDRREVGLLFRAADVSVLLTNFEGTPISLFESLACGCPVVVSDVADHRKFVKNGKNGFLAKNGKPKLAGKSIGHVLNEQPRFAVAAAKSGEVVLASRIVPTIMQAVQTAQK